MPSSNSTNASVLLRECLFFFASRVAGLGSAATTAVDAHTLAREWCYYFLPGGMGGKVSFIFLLPLLLYLYFLIFVSVIMCRVVLVMGKEVLALLISSVDNMLDTPPPPPSPPNVYYASNDARIMDHNDTPHPLRVASVPCAFVFLPVDVVEVGSTERAADISREIGKDAEGPEVSSEVVGVMCRSQAASPGSVAELDGAVDFCSPASTVALLGYEGLVSSHDPTTFGGSPEPEADAALPPDPQISDAASPPSNHNLGVSLPTTPDHPDVAPPADPTPGILSPFHYANSETSLPPYPPSQPLGGLGAAGFVFTGTEVGPIDALCQQRIDGTGNYDNCSDTSSEFEEDPGYTHADLPGTGFDNDSDDDSDISSEFEENPRYIPTSLGVTSGDGAIPRTTPELEISVGDSEVPSWEISPEYHDSGDDQTVSSRLDILLDAPGCTWPGPGLGRDFFPRGPDGSSRRWRQLMDDIPPQEVQGTRVRSELEAAGHTGQLRRAAPFDGDWRPVPLTPQAREREEKRKRELERRALVGGFRQRAEEWRRRVAESRVS